MLATIRSSKLGDVNLESWSGNTDTTNLTTTKLTAKCSSGNMNFNGAFGGKTDLQSKSGNVDFSTSIAEDQYSYGLSVFSGNIKVNGSSDAQHIKQNNGAANNLTVSNRSGNVSVNFQK